MHDFTQRAATLVLETIGRKLWGFAPALMPEIVRQLGPAKAFGWFARNMPRYEKTRRVMGALRTHLLAIEISLFNGCPYCTFGHALAFQLLYLKRYDRLFPLDEHGLVALRGKNDEELAGMLRDALGGDGGLVEELPWLQRMLELRGGAIPKTEDDLRLQHLIDMFGVLNMCGIRGRVAPDEAHDPVNKDGPLKRRYRALREHERLRSIPTEVGTPTRADLHLRRSSVS